MKRRTQRPANAGKLAEAVDVLRRVAQQYPDSMLALAATTAIEIGTPALIIETAEVFGRRLNNPQRPGFRGLGG